MAERNIKKQLEVVDKQERSLKVIREEMMCDCDHKHRQSGDIDIVPAQNRSPGELKYKCRRCRKDLDLKKISEQDLRDACVTIDKAIDVIKLSLDPQREDDAKILKRVSKVQYRVRNDISKLYAASLQKNKTGGRRGNKNRNSDDSAWAKPIVR